MIKQLVTTLTLVSLFLLAATPATAELKINDKDTVILFGDTAFGQPYTSDWIDQLLRIKYPELKAQVICFGESRCSAAQGNQRLASEVLPLKPTKVILCFGLDEPDRKAFQKKTLDSFVAEMTKMIDTLVESGAQVTLLTPPPPDESRNRGLQRVKYDGVIAKYAVAVQKLGQEKNLDVLDWNAAVKGILSRSGNPDALRWTKHGIMPSGISIAAMTDLIFTYWNVEPIRYLVTADWKNGSAATASTGSAEVTQLNEDRMVVNLKNVPVALNNDPRGTIPIEDWPLAKWCDYKIKIDNLPTGGVIIGSSGKGAKPYLSQQLAVGADMATVGPLVDNDATRTLRNAIRTKLNQFNKYRSFCHQEVPEPELKEGYDLWREAHRILAFASQKIVMRTPITFDITITVDLAKQQVQLEKSISQDKKPPTKPRTGH